MHFSVSILDDLIRKSAVNMRIIPIQISIRKISTIQNQIAMKFPFQGYSMVEDQVEQHGN